MQLLQLETLGGVIEVLIAARRALVRKQSSSAAQIVPVTWQVLRCALPGILGAARSQE